MRYLAMQTLTWGTIAAAICSAVLLAALESPTTGYLAALPLGTSLGLLTDPPQAGRAPPGSSRLARTHAGAASSAPSAAGR